MPRGVHTHVSSGRKCHLLDHAIGRVLQSEGPWHRHNSGLLVDNIDIDACKGHIVRGLNPVGAQRDHRLACCCPALWLCCDMMDCRKDYDEG